MARKSIGSFDRFGTDRPVTTTKEKVQQAANAYAEANYRQFIGRADMTVRVSPFDFEHSCQIAHVHVGLRKESSGFIDFRYDGTLRFATTPQAFKDNLDKNSGQ